MKTTKAVEYIYRKLGEFTSKNIKELTKQELDEFIQLLIKDLSYTTGCSYIALLNKVLRIECNGCIISMSDYKLGIKTKGYMKKDDLMGIINLLDSYQDKFILMAIFNGIAGKQLSELINLKMEQVDLNKGIIKLENRVVKMNDEFKKITELAMSQDKGLVITEDSLSLNVYEYDFNMKSEYVIKVRPYAKNNFGLNPMSYNGIRTRLYDIANYLGVDIIATAIEKSGYLDRMNREKTEWTVAKAREWAKREGIKVEGNNLLKLYKSVY